MPPTQQAPQNPPTATTSTVQTVLGPVPSNEFHGVLHHEHLLSLTPGRWLSGGSGDFDDQQVEMAAGALAGLADAGVDTVVDLSPYGVAGRDSDGTNLVLLQEVARRSGLHVVAGTAVYLEAMSPEWTREADLDAITDRFLRDTTTGIGTSTVTAGILGEQATGLNEITGHEEKCFRAAARVHRDTGLAMTTHATHGTMALEQISLLRQEQADLSRVLIGHMDTHHDLDYIRQVLAAGVNIGFDTVGKQNWDFFLGPPLQPRTDGPFIKQAYHQSDLTRARWLAQLVADGYEDQILLAQDLTGAEVYLNPDTHGQWGYRYLTGPFTRLLLETGVTPDQVAKMTGTNPVRLLTRTTHARSAQPGPTRADPTHLTPSAEPEQP